MTYYTIHPYGDEWLWDDEADGGGVQPWVFTDLEVLAKAAATYHAELLERTNLTGPWSGVGGWNVVPRMEPWAGGRQIVPREGFSASFDAGWVDPAGVYHPASEGDPPVDEHGAYKEEATSAEIVSS